MINQPLLDFIKQQLQVGSTKEKISSDLLANGWNSQDIDEGFKAVNIPILNIPSGSPVSSYGHIDTSISPITPITSSQPKTHSSKKVFKIFLIILVLFLLAEGASIYYLRNYSVNSSDITNTVQQSEIPLQTPVQTDNTQIVIPAEQPDSTTPTSTTPTIPPPALDTSVPTSTSTTQPDSVATEEQLNKERDTVAKKALENAAIVAEPYWDKGSSYAGFCKSNEYANAVKDIIEPTTLNCKDSIDEYSITASMSSGGYWCVDNVFYNNRSSFNTGTVCRQ
ncbi:MAG: hypothetical protein WC447_00130 [Candidatus Paceibacterota bacterium]